MDNIPKETEELLRRFQDWIQIEVAQGDAGRHTERSYLSSTRGYFAWCLNREIEPIRATEDEIKLYRAQLIQKAYTRGTIKTKLAGIQRFYDALQDWGVRLDNPAEKVKAKKDLTSQAEKIAEKYISDREGFLNLWKLPDKSNTLGVRNRAILRVLCFTGIRVSELCGLDISDIKDGVNPRLLIRGGKGMKRRHVPLGKTELKIIQEWIDVRDHIGGDGDQALFLALDNRTRGRRLGPRGARSVVNRYLRQAGLKRPGRSCHALRHSLATWLLDAGVPTEVIADLLGHSSIAITAVYAKVVDKHRYVPGDVLQDTER